MAQEKLNSDDYYEVLGVPRSATDAQIKAAYKKLAIKYHPDKNPGDTGTAEQNFKKVSEAYEVLSSKEKRATYDQIGKSGLHGSGGMPSNFSQAQANEIFSQFFGGQDPFSVLFGDMANGNMGGMGGMGGVGGGGRPAGMQFQFHSSTGGGMPGMDPAMFQQMGGMGGGGGRGGMGGMGGMPGMMGMGGMPGMAGMGGMPGMGSMGGMGGGGRRRREERPELIPSGTPVTIRGLQGAAQHNNKRGKVVEHDAASGRYTVLLDDGESLRIKPENLLQRLLAEVVGMQSRTEFNGKKGHVDGFDENSGRYHVSLQQGQALALQPANLILPKGARGRVVGLVSGAQYNARIGKVVDYDGDSGRYTVELDAENQLRVKRGNLLCAL